MAASSCPTDSFCFINGSADTVTIDYKDSNGVVLYHGNVPGGNFSIAPIKYVEGAWLTANKFNDSASFTAYQFKPGDFVNFPDNFMFTFTFHNNTTVNNTGQCSGSEGITVTAVNPLNSLSSSYMVANGSSLTIGSPYGTMLLLQAYPPSSGNYSCPITVTQNDIYYPTGPNPSRGIKPTVIDFVRVPPLFGDKLSKKIKKRCKYLSS